MSARPGDVSAVLETLVSEALVEPDRVRALEPRPAELERAQPWYVRAMVGVGAWIAAAFLIVFFVATGIATTGGGYVALGLLLVAGACALRRRTGDDFAGQLALAASLAGQGTFAFGVAGTELALPLETILVALVAINAVLLAFFPDKTHRFVSVLLVAGAAVGLVYARGAAFLVPGFAPALAALVLVSLEREAALVSRGWLEALAPVRAGAMAAAFGCAILSTFYVAPEIADDVSFYPRPWISTVLLGLLLFRVEGRIAPLVLGTEAARWAVRGLTALFLLAALPAPGLVLAVLVLALSGLHGLSAYRAAAIAFLGFFAAAFFYGIEVPMPVKSASLIATGALVLWCRRLFLNAAPGPESGHA